MTSVWSAPMSTEWTSLIQSFLGFSCLLILSRQQIADVLGLTIETVSRQMTDMKRQGLIDLVGRRGVRLVDEAALERLAEIS